ncbi:MAG: GEVED domain-containing protein [Bacteroidia bacterium]|nr:GEVED domain-containing protein [Bacteroidia bacterium]
MRQFVLLGLLSLLALPALAQYPLSGAKPATWDLPFEAKAATPALELPPLDDAALLAEDVLRSKQGYPGRYGVVVPLSLSPATGGSWRTLKNGSPVWIGKIHAEGAKAIRVYLRNYRLTKGASISLYNEDQTVHYGAYTAAHNNDEGIVPVLPIPGETVYIEYVPGPNGTKDAPFEVYQITQAYRDVFAAAREKAFGQSGSCNINVNCTDGAPWADEKRGIVLILNNGGDWCTGSMINNTAQDGTPYVLTANHCFEGAGNTIAGWSYVFNFESPTCTSAPASYSQQISGSTLRARLYDSDFVLAELSQDVPDSYNAFFNGWDRSSVTVPTATVCIHHPSGDIKKISFDDAAPVIATDEIEPPATAFANNVWRVEWDRNSTTEGGSSGSPLFNGTTGLIIGQLWGGSASCTNLSGTDIYGRFSLSWDRTGATSANSLKSWLDPTNSGVTTLAGANFGGGPTPPAVYCASGSGNTEPDGTVNGITFGTINTSSPTGAANCTGYTDRTASASTSLTAGAAVPLTIKIHNCRGVSDSYGKVVRAWIDWNGDSDFDDTGELVYSSGLMSGTLGYPDRVTTVNVPADVVNGRTVRMRVILRETATGETDPTASSNTQPCGTFTWGETEDYTLNLVNPTTANDPSQATQSRLAVYPNPAEAEFSITWQAPQLQPSVQATVVSASGQLVASPVLTYSADDAAYTARVTSTGWAKGLYLVRLQTETGEEVLRRVVVR